MNVLVVEGMVTNDFELKEGGNGKKYVNFSVAVVNGFGNAKHTFFIECLAFESMAERIRNAKVKKGSYIKVVGNLDVKDYIRKSDGTQTKIVKMTILDWSFSLSVLGKEEREKVNEALKGTL